MIEVRREYGPNPVFGSGYDGDLVFDGSSDVAGLTPSSSIYTLTAEIAGNNITINQGVTVRVQGYGFWCKGELINNGIIENKANNASGTTGGAVISSQGSFACSATAGQNGRATTGVGSNGLAQTNSCSGGDGGDGGSGGGQAGGTGGNSSLISTGLYADIGYVFRRRLTGTTAGNGGAGGGSGGANVGTGTAVSGGGGSGAGIVAIVCDILTNNGTIRSNGGNGGNASVTGDGAAGGGGGGGGGAVYIVANRVKAEGTIQANGGTGGAGAGGGSNGEDGTSGVVYKFYRT